MKTSSGVGRTEPWFRLSTQIWQGGWADGGRTYFSNHAVEPERALSQNSYGRSRGGRAANRKVKTKSLSYPSSCYLRAVMTMGPSA